MNKRPHLTPEGLWRFDVEPSALRRKSDWDYRQPGSYAITLTLADRSRDWLGRLERTSEQARSHERGTPEQALAHERGTPEQALAHGQQALAHGRGTPEQALAHGQQALAHGQQTRSLGRARERAFYIALTPLGEAVLRLWRELPALWPGIETREAQVMPEHFHGILRVTTPQRHPLGQIIGSFKAKATAAARQLAQEGGATVPPGVLAGEGLFSPGLHDRILWGLERYRNARDYLLANPDRLAVKRANPELFRFSRELAVELRITSEQARSHGRGTPEQALAHGQQARSHGRGTPEQALAHGQQARSHGRGTSEQARSHGQQALAHGQGAGLAGSPELAREVGYFSALGNHFLLQRPMWQIQVSRRDFAYRRGRNAANGRLEIERDAGGEPIAAISSPTYASRREAAFAAAANGDVLISPCVSDGERQIAREALAAGLPLVVLRNMGFSRNQKPSGRAFEACAEGRLLMLAPSAWPWQPGEKTMTRDDAVAMNRLCQWLVGENAAEINYHGMTPANVDTIALAAVMAVLV